MTSRCRRPVEKVWCLSSLLRVCTTMKASRTGQQRESCAPDYSIHFVNYSIHFMNYSIHFMNYSIHFMNYSIHFMTDTSCPIDIGLVKSAAAKDPIMQLLKNTIYNGWPGYRKQCPKELWDYWNIRCDLVLEGGLILKGDRVVVPESLRAQVLEAIHTGHQAETKCLLLARQSVFWPVSLTILNQCMNGTPERTSGNRAGFSAAKTLTENQEHTLLK